MNTQIIFLSIGLVISGLLSGCASTPKSGDETLLWSSAKERPEWTTEEPGKVGDQMVFSGLSDTHATEKNAREDAQRTVTANIVNYMGTIAKKKFEQARVSFGLSSSIIDPTTSVRTFQKQLANNVVSRVKPQKWYVEKWQTRTGIGYRAFLLANVPQAALDGAYNNMAQDMAYQAERRAKVASDDMAKEQAEKATDFWKQMASQGLVE